MIQRNTHRYKVAIVHDTLLELGGAERVLSALLDTFPQADLFTSLATPSLKEYFGHRLKKTIWPNPWWFGPLNSSILKPLILIYWRTLDFSPYDIVISSSHSFSSKSINTAGKPHLSYIHTPPKYLYLEYNQMNWIKWPPIAALLHPFIRALRFLDFTAAQTPTVLIANSKTTQRRITSYYNRKSIVIYPPVESAFYQVKQKTPRYYVFHSRHVKQKGLELVVAAFSQINEKLIIVGTGPLTQKVKKTAQNNCSFVGRVSDAQLLELLSHAKATIFCGIDEDFGLVMAESLAAGVPVIAFRSPAAQELIRSNKTGILFSDYTVESLRAALRSFTQRTFSSRICRVDAQKYHKRVFARKLKQLMLSYLPS